MDINIVRCKRNYCICIITTENEIACIIVTANVLCQLPQSEEICYDSITENTCFEIQTSSSSDVMDDAIPPYKSSKDSETLNESEGQDAIHV